MSLVALLSKVLPIHIPYYYTTFVTGKSPFSTYGSVITALATYLAVIFGIQHVLKDQKPFKLNAIFRLHNLILSVGSGLLLALIAEEAGPLLFKRGLFSSICDDDSYTPRLEAYYMVNYFFKYLELFDTVLLALKKKDLKFLHVFHHSATVVLCFFQLQGRTSMSWAIIGINLLVHVAMYYYYFASAGGAKIWWKKYLTSMQIIQFVIDLSLVYTGLATEGAYRYARWIPHPGHCAGTKTAGLFAGGLLTSYLFLFIHFYQQTYEKPAIKPVTTAVPETAGARKSKSKRRAGRGHKRTVSRQPNSH